MAAVGARVALRATTVDVRLAAVLLPIDARWLATTALAGSAGAVRVGKSFRTVDELDRSSGPVAADSRRERHDGVDREGHFGLTMMGEQAALAGGELSLDSSAGGGTRIEVVVPLAGDRPEVDGESPDENDRPADERGEQTGERGEQTDDVGRTSSESGERPGEKVERP